jgi:tetratricopeptide (TPR) repeat protein
MARRSWRQFPRCLAGLGKNPGKHPSTSYFPSNSRVPSGLARGALLEWRGYSYAKPRSRADLRKLAGNPSYELPHLVLGQAYEEKGAFNLAISELQKALELSHGTPLMVSALAHAYARAGNKLEAEKLLKQLERNAKTKYVSPYYFAVVYLGLGDDAQAMNWLEKAFADRSNGLVFMRVEPELDHLRSNPRFLALQQRLRFPL